VRVKLVEKHGSTNAMANANVIAKAKAKTKRADTFVIRCHEEKI